MSIKTINQHDATQLTNLDDINILVEDKTLEIVNEKHEKANLGTLFRNIINAVHTHLNKTVLDGITSQKVSAWDGKAEISDIPTKLSELSNDLGLIDKTVNNLVNYYKKTETYTQAEVNSLISTARTGGFRVVATLPAASAECVGYIYLVPKTRTKTQNVKDEYICVAQGTTPETYAWEKIGDTEVDLTEYRKAAAQDIIDQALQSAIDTISNAYLKNATVSNETLTITKQDGSTIQFQGGGNVRYFLDETDNTVKIKISY